MAFTRKLKQLMMFNDGNAYVGDTVSITPPKLTRKFEEYRAGGMNRPVSIDMGGEKLEMEATYGGFMRHPGAAGHAQFGRRPAALRRQLPG